MSTLSSCLAFALIVPSIAFCNDDALPKAEDVWERWISVAGGAEVYQRIQSRRMIWESSYSSNPQLTSRLVRENTRPDSIRGTTNYSDGRTSSWGHHAGVSWSTADGKAELMTEEFASRTRLSTRTDFEHDWHKLYKSVSVTGKEDYNGVECFEFRATSSDGLQSTFYFEVESGLMRGSKERVKSPSGATVHSRVFTDYQKVDGVLIPHKAIARIDNEERGSTLEINARVVSIEHNVDFPKGHFEPPAEIKALRKKEKDGSKD